MINTVTVDDDDNNNNNNRLHAIQNLASVSGEDRPNRIVAWEPQLILPLARFERSTPTHAFFPWGPAKRVQYSTKQSATAPQTSSYSQKPPR